MKREKILETIKEFPQEFDLDEFIERLIFVDKVEKGVRQLDESKTITHEAVKEKAKQW